jgi:hypothetical protein
MTTYHVHTSRGGWIVRRTGAARASSRHSTKAEAVSAARATVRAKGGELVVHRRDGLVSFRSGRS